MMRFRPTGLTLHFPLAPNQFLQFLQSPHWPAEDGRIPFLENSLAQEKKIKWQRHLSRSPNDIVKNYKKTYLTHTGLSISILVFNMNKHQRISRQFRKDSHTKETKISRNGIKRKPICQGAEESSKTTINTLTDTGIASMKQKQAVDEKH